MPTELDSAQLEEALRLNAQLKEMETQLMSHVGVSAMSRGFGSTARGGGRVGAAGAGGYGGRTFTHAQEQDIIRNNAHLVSKLARVRGEMNNVLPPPPRAQSREGHASINRRKKETEIERENARLVARIQGQKSSFSGMKPPPTKPKPTSGVGTARGGQSGGVRGSSASGRGGGGGGGFGF